MEHYDLIYRILKGYYYITINSKKFKIVLPDFDLIYKSEKYYEKILNNLKFDNREDWLNEDKRLFILNYHGIWNNDQQQKLDNILKDLDKIKIQLFLNFNSESTRTFLKDKISEAYSDIEQLHRAKYTYFEYTKQSYATILKNKYIIKNTVYYKNKLFFKDYRNTNKDFYLHKLLAEINHTLSGQEIRALVQTEIWKSFWDCAKTRIFGKPIIKCNEEQRLAINTSQMFDNIKKHPKCPKEEVLKDSDALDGWILYQNQEQEKEKRKAEIESSINDKNAGEVFVMASSPEEIKEIMNLNDPQTKQEIRSMHKFLQNKKDAVKWEEIPAMRERIIREGKRKQ